MQFRQRRKLAGNADNRVLVIAIAFLCCAFVSAVVRADVKSVEGLEFSHVLLTGDNQLEFTQGEDTVLKILGDDDDLSPLPFVVSGDTLSLGVNKEGQQVSDVKYKVSASGLESLALKGSGEAFVKPLAVKDLLVSLEGSGVIRMFDVQALDLEMRVIGSGTLQAVNVKASKARLNMQGSGDIQLGSLRAEHIRTHLAGSGDIAVEEGGETGLIEVSVMGSGDVDLGQLAAGEADVTIMGSGDVELRVRDRLDVEIMGSGDLLYFGSPEISTSVMGSGDVVQRD